MPRGYPIANDRRRAEDLAIVAFNFEDRIGGFMVMRQLPLRFRCRERWRFARDQIAADPSWQFTSRRTLRVDDDMTVRRTRPFIQFISRGAVLSLGPFKAIDAAERLMRHVRSLHPTWTWESA